MGIDQKESDRLARGKLQALLFESVKDLAEATELIRLLEGALQSIRCINSAIPDERHDFKWTVQLMRDRAGAKLESPEFKKWKEGGWDRLLGEKI